MPWSHSRRFNISRPALSNEDSSISFQTCKPHFVDWVAAIWALDFFIHIRRVAPSRCVSSNYPPHGCCGNTRDYTATCNGIHLSPMNYDSPKLPPGPWLAFADFAFVYQLDTQRPVVEPCGYAESSCLQQVFHIILCERNLNCRLAWNFFDFHHEIPPF